MSSMSHEEKGLLAETRLIPKSSRREQYNEVVRTILTNAMTCEQRSLWTWELYLWAATVMSSRSFPGPAVFNQPEDEFATYSDDPEGKAPVLIPGLDLLNHFPSSRVAWLWDSTACTIKTDELLAGGIEVPNNYGPKSNEELIMGYGFSLPDNPADHFSIAFSPAIAAYINTTKAFRSIGCDGRLPEEADDFIEGTPEPTRNHWVRVRDKKPEFSEHFLEDFSIALENPREYGKADLCRQLSFNLMDAALSRNKLHVICAILMILQKGQLSIRKYDRDLPKCPRNAKQEDAARYRRNQLDILDSVIDSLTGRLKHLFDKCTNNVDNAQLMRLEDALVECPRSLLRDFRSVLNRGMKTRDPNKIRERGGTDFAFTVWLCGLSISSQPCAKEYQDRGNEEPRISTYLSLWLRFLDETYPYDGNDKQTPESYSKAVQESDRAEWFDPVRNLAVGEDMTTDPTSTVATYMHAIQATTGTHPESIYNSPEVNEKRLKWCYNIIKHEGIWFPNLTDKEGDDEWVLFLERLDDHTR